MLFHFCVLFFLGLVSVSHTAPLTCEELVQPLDQLDSGYIDGKWALVAGSVRYLPKMEKFKKRDSAVVYFPSNTSEPHVSFTRASRVDNKCHYKTYNITMKGSSFTFDGTRASNSTSNFVRTSCPDCLLVHFEVEIANRTHLYLFSRRRELGPGELQELTEQARCLHLPQPAVMDPTKELCPEQTQD